MNFNQSMVSTKMEVTPTTEIRHLFRDMPSAMESLSLILDMNDAWRKLAERIPANRNDSAPLYNLSDIRQMKRSHEGPTKALLLDWGTHGRKDARPTIEDMKRLLCECELYRAADYLAVTVLMGNPVDRNLPVTKAEMERLHLANSTSIHENNALSSPEAGKMEMNSPVEGLLDLGKGEPISVGDVRSTVYNVSHSQSVVVGDVPNQKNVATNKEGESTNPNNFNLVLPNLNLPHFHYSDLETMTAGFDNTSVADGGRRLGSGAFSTVFLGHWHNAQSGTTRSVAVKKMDIKFKEQFLMEVELMASFQHRCVLLLFGYSMDSSNFCLVYEYMVNGSLQDRLARLNNMPKLPWRTRLQIVADTAQGLVSLHSQGYVHRDVKSANILLDENFRAKLGDFGIAHIAPDPTRYTSLETKVPIGTSVYMPREAFNGTVTCKLDTYSFGVVLLEILTGRKPYDLEKKEDLISFVEDEEIQVDTIDQYLDPNGGDWSLAAAKDVFALSEKCLQEKRPKRPEMFEVMPKLITILQKIKREDAAKAVVLSDAQDFAEAIDV